MGCSFADSCSECTVGCDLDCSAWDPDEHRKSYEDFDYDDDCYEDDSDEISDIEAGWPRCKTCYAPVNPNWSYCPACGTFRSKRQCLQCGFETTADWKTCPHCGKLLFDPLTIFRPIYLPPDTLFPEDEDGVSL